MKPIEAVTAFDWISPLLQVGQGLFKGMKTIDCTMPGYTGLEIRNWLNTCGVQTGTAMIVDGTLLIPVDDEERAYQALVMLGNL